MGDFGNICVRSAAYATTVLYLLNCVVFLQIFAQMRNIKLGCVALESQQILGRFLAYLLFVVCFLCKEAMRLVVLY